MDSKYFINAPKSLARQEISLNYTYDPNSDQYKPQVFDRSTVGLFGELKTASLDPQIELKSSYGTSILRDYIVASGGGVSHAGPGNSSEYEVFTSGNSTGEFVKFESAAKGRYQPGYSAEVGVGVRFEDETPVGNQIAKWGYFDSKDGLYFGLNSEDLFVGIKSNEEDTVIPRSEWNVDKLDGTGPSKYTIDVKDGYVYQIDFGWYGYSSIEWSILTRNRGIQERTIVHRQSIFGRVSLNNPNLPISIGIDNNETLSPVRIYVAGRQFSVLGNYKPFFRITSERRIALATSTTFVPVISFRKKQAFSSALITPEGFECLVASQDVVIQVRIGGTLTSPSWITPTDTLASETAVEADVSATAITGGVVIWEGLLPAGQGNSRGFGETQLADIPIPNATPVSLCLRSITGNGTASAVFRLLEEW